MSAFERARKAFFSRRESYRAIFEQGIAGPRVLGELFHLCYVGRANDGKTEFERGVIEGQRRVYLHIKSMIRTSDDELIRMAEDHYKEIAE